METLEETTNRRMNNIKAGDIIHYEVNGEEKISRVVRVLKRYLIDSKDVKWNLKTKKEMPLTKSSRIIIGVSTKEYWENEFKLANICAPLIQFSKNRTLERIETALILNKIDLGLFGGVIGQMIRCLHTLESVLSEIQQGNKKQ